MYKDNSRFKDVSLSLFLKTTKSFPACQLRSDPPLLLCGNLLSHFLAEKLVTQSPRTTSLIYQNCSLCQTQTPNFIINYYCLGSHHTLFSGKSKPTLCHL
nr:hypothetical protein Itr_chr03CG17150 [Ipomoea trifida]